MRLFLVAVASLAISYNAHAIEWEFNANNRFFFERLPESVTSSRLQFPGITSTTAPSRATYQLHMFGHVSGRPIDALGLQLGLDTGLMEFGDGSPTLDGRPFIDTLERTALLGETHAELQFGQTGWALLRAGKLRPQIGDGAVFDTYAFGATLDLDLDLLSSPIPLSTKLQVLLPDGTFSARSKRSPLINLEVAYKLGANAKIKLMGAVLIDRDNSLAQLFDDALTRGRVQELSNQPDRVIDDVRCDGPVCSAALDRLRDSIRTILTEAGQLSNDGTIGYDIQTSGVVGWLGLNAAWTPAPLHLSGTLLVGLGQVDADVRPNAGFQDFITGVFPRIGSFLLEQQTSEQRIELRSLYGQLNAKLSIMENLSLDAFGVFMSGDRGLSNTPEQSQRYGAFVSLAPLLTQTSIFFNRGIASNVSTPAVVSIAPDGAGLLSGGLGGEYMLWERVRFRALIALLGATVPSETGGRFYGVEADLQIDAPLFHYFFVALDSAILVPGNYYNNRSLGVQIIASVRALLP